VGKRPTLVLCKVPREAKSLPPSPQDVEVERRKSTKSRSNCGGQRSGSFSHSSKHSLLREILRLTPPP
jgi:hypothetical protein